jgi:uncharacterized protein
VPTLLFYGEADSWTPVEPSVEAWRAARGDEVEIVVVPEAEHDLTLPDGNLAPLYEQTLVEWLCRFTAPQREPRRRAPARTPRSP